MGALEKMIQVVLYACFAVYLLMGLTFIILGAVYHTDEGAAGSAGLYLILVGVVMLVIGGISVFGNWKKSWLILFVIELVNIAMFLVR